MNTRRISRSLPPVPGSSLPPVPVSSPPHRPARLLVPALLLLLGPLLPLQDAAAQGVNGRARTYVNYMEIRELVLDSVPASQVPGEGVQRTLSDGTSATCGEAQCIFYRSGPEVSVVPVLQDVELNVWTGITGLRAYAHVRGRIPQGDRELWPRSDESFEALTAYVEYARSFYRIQAGRIWQTTALGFYNYDGGSLAMRLPLGLNLDVYGGLSLVRGLNQLHHTDLISSVENPAPRFDSYLGGIHARWRPGTAFSAALTYQQEGTRRADDLYSERIAGSARLLLGPATLDAEIKYDLAGKTTNLARARLSSRLGGGFRGSLEVRKYVPFFELWTIWGAFSPVGFNEASGRLDWMAASGRFSGHAYASRRQYENTDAEPPPEYGIRDDAWRIGVGGRVNLQERLTLSGEYRRDVGYGSTRNGGDMALQRSFGERASVGVQGTAFETFSEFRVGSGRVVGGGLVARSPLGPATLQGSAMLYKHTTKDRPSILDLNQTRIQLTVEVPIGRDPGLAERRLP